MPYRPRPTNHADTMPGKRSYQEWSEAARKDKDWLIEWQRRNNFSDEEAADALALSVSGFHKQRSGTRAVSNQTAKLALLSMIDVERMLDIAHWAMNLAQRGINRR
jgi:hypothetical protein